MGSASNTTTIAIVEDEKRLRENLRAFIDETPGFACVGAWATGEDALREIPALRPSVVLMDINLPGMSGIDCIRRLVELVPGIHVVILTMYDDSDVIFRALESGAVGYLLKRTPLDELTVALRDLQDGGAPMSSSIARKVVQSFRSKGPSLHDSENLTAREEDVLRLVAGGLINKEIAEELGIGIETVRSHLKNIYDKLHVRSRTEAAMKFFSR